MNDNEFIRGSVPMTKSEVRSVTISKLNIFQGMEVLDIGAGTGSISIECAIKGCHVTAIERNPEGIKLIEKNTKHFKLENINIIDGLAPNDLPKDTLFKGVFIGGSGGKLDGIFLYLKSNLEVGGILVANTITIENTSKILSLMEEHGYLDIEAVSMNISRSKKVGSVTMMIAENPITIISGKKGE